MLLLGDRSKFQSFPPAFQDIWCWLEGLSSCGETGRGRWEEEEEEKGHIFRIQFEIISAIRCLWGKLKRSPTLQRWLSALHTVFIWNLLYIKKTKYGKPVVYSVQCSIRNEKKNSSSCFLVLFFLIILQTFTDLPHPINSITTRNVPVTHLRYIYYFFTNAQQSCV